MTVHLVSHPAPIPRFSHLAPEPAMPSKRQESFMRRALRPPRWCAVVVCLAAVAGCERGVEERVWWSPDGSLAAVDGRPGLRLMRPDGTLSEPIFDDGVQGVSWLQDGSGLVVARTIEVATWDEAKPLLPQEEVDAIEAWARTVPAVIRAIADGEVKNLGDLLASPDFFSAEVISLYLKMAEWAGVCVRDRHGEELRAALRALPPNFFDMSSDAEPEARPPSDDEKFAELWRGVQGAKLRLHELALVPIAGGKVSGKIRPLFGSVRSLSGPAVTPRGDWVAVRWQAEGDLVGDGGPPQTSLMVLDLEGEQRIQVANHVCSDPVWLADGVTLAYVTSESGDQGPAALKTLERKTLVADGPDTMKAGDGTAVMVGLFPTGAYGTRLAVLPRDRLLLAAAEMTLPLRPDAESPPRVRLFIIDAAADSKAPPVPVHTAADALPQDLAAFAVSPDGTRAAVVEARSDAVAVVDLATGRVDPVAAATGENTRCGTLPAWRNGRELLIQTCRKTGDTHDTWAIWRQGEPLRWLDETWTDAEKKTLPHVPKKE
jgi:hypothetical protein